jgi:hypothetical protein
MTKRSPKTIALSAALTLLAVAGYAQEPLTSVGISQNFDGMGIPTSLTAVQNLPANFRVDSQASGNVRTVGTFAAALTSTNKNAGPGLSSSQAQGVYDFGAGGTATPNVGNSDRAIGFLASGSGTASGNLYLQMVNNTGGPLSGLQISYNVEKYRNGSNSTGFRMQLYSSTDGTVWTITPGSTFTTNSPNDGNVNGFTPAPASPPTAVSGTLSASIASGATFYLAWNYSVISGSTVTSAPALAIDDISIAGVSASPTNPTGAGAASPSAVQAGNSTALSVAVTPGANPTSSSLAVTVDLSSIGGSATQTFFDDGPAGGHGDQTAGDNTFTFTATVDPLTTAGGKSLPFTITDAQSRTGTGSIALTVSAVPPTNPTATGSANPNSIVAGGGTLLTATVTPGANPTSSGIAVKVDLTSIGGPATQTMYDDGTHGDVTAGDLVFSFSATVDGATSAGGKSLPVSVTDTQSRTASTSISLTVTAPVPAPTSVKISQVYGGGGNSGATFKNDFIELFNQSTFPVDITGWSVQQISAGGTGTWNVTPLCPSGTCSIQPGHYFLVQEAQGNGGTTNLPTPDVTGSIAMGAASGKVTLVDNSVALSGGCPSSVAIADLVGYDPGSATCSETSPAPQLSNTTAALRKGNGCTDTNNNSTDFTEVGPLPRNSSAPAHTCPVAGNLSGLGTASPSTFFPGGSTLLKVQVTPGTGSTGITVTGDLTSIGGSANQTFYDDATNGDVTAGDNTFSFFITTAVLPTGAKYITTTVSDQQGHTVTVPITVTFQSPTCGVERWTIKVGTDAGASSVNLASPQRTTISNLRSFTAPADPPGPPINSRVAPAENTVYVVNALLTQYKLEDDVDYHIVIQDPSGQTMITEIPSPACDGSGSPFDAGIKLARQKFDGRFTAFSSFQVANVPVQVKGVGFFDFLHGQTGVAPNGIELHPLLDIIFTAQSTTTLVSDIPTSLYGQTLTLTATVTIPSGTPTGNVSFFDGATPLGTAALNGAGQAQITASGLAAGAHTLKASYEGDSAASESSGTFSQQVNPATPVLSWAHPADIIYGSALSSSQLNATANVPGSFAYNPPAGTVLPVGNNQQLNATFTPTSSNYSSGPVSTLINVLPGQQPTGPSISVTRVLSRDGSNNIVVQLTLTNTGGTTASNVMLTSLKVGAVTAPGLPIAVGNIAPNSSAVLTVNMGNPVGPSGTASSLTASGTFTGGGFNSSWRSTLP